MDEVAECMPGADRRNVRGQEGLCRRQTGVRGGPEAGASCSIGQREWQAAAVKAGRAKWSSNSLNFALNFQILIAIRAKAM